MKNQILLVLAVVFVACSTPSTGPTPSPVPSVAPIAIATVDADHQRPNTGIVLPPPVVDTRTPAQIAQAACNGRCTGSAIPKTLMASGQTPIIPPAWTVPAWDIDPANSVGCAGDNLSGTSATCSGGCVGSTCPSGIGPLLTYQELLVHRWLSLGNPILSPRLRQTTTITFLSNHTDNTDPVYVSVATENGASLIIQGVLGAAQQVCSTTLSAVTAKNRATPQLLNVTFASCASAAAHQLVVNTTHPSKAWIYTAGGGGSWNMSQPLTNQVIPGGPPTEVDTWSAAAGGDAVNVYTPVSVNLAALANNLTDYNGGFNNSLYVSQLTGFDPSGVADDDLHVGVGITFAESSMQRAIIALSSAQDAPQFFFNTDNRAAIFSAAGASEQNAVNGGILKSFATQREVTLRLTNDPIVASNTVTTGTLAYGDVYVETGVTLTLFNGTTRPESSPGQIVWGPGIVNLAGFSRWQYASGASGGATTFVNAGGITLNSQSLACKGQPGAGGITIACNLALNAALLDTNAGATSGCTFVAGGASFCNFGP